MFPFSKTNTLFIPPNCFLSVIRVASFIPLSGLLSFSKSLINFIVPSFFIAAVKIDKEFLAIASIGSTSIFSSDPFIGIFKGLLGNEPPAMVGAVMFASSTIVL